MPHEHFRVRIKKGGIVQLEARGLSEARLRELREMVEDALGPVEEIMHLPDEGSPPGGVGIVDAETRGELELKKRGE